MTAIILGIDPGVSGAVAVIQNKEVLEVHDLPTLTTLKTTKTKSGKLKKRNEIDIETFFILYKDLLRAWHPQLIVIEKVHAITKPGEKKQGVSSMFSFGQTFGRIEGVIRTTGGIPIKYVSPQEWKKHHNLIKKGKEAAVALCRLHYPTMATTFLKSKDGRADAVLMAEYGRYLILTNKEG